MVLFFIFIDKVFFNHDLHMKIYDYMTWSCFVSSYLEATILSFLHCLLDYFICNSYSQTHFFLLNFHLQLTSLQVAPHIAFTIYT